MNFINGVEEVKEAESAERKEQVKNVEADIQQKTENKIELDDFQIVNESSEKQ